MRSARVVAALLSALLTTTACTAGSTPGTSATTTTAAPTTTTWATTTTTTTPPTTTTLPPPAPLQGEAWPALPLLDVAEARDGDLMIAGPDGVMLVRDGEPLGLLHDKPTQAAAPDGLGGVVYQTPFRVEDGGDHDVWWLPPTGGREYLGITGSPLGSFRLQEVDWVPRLGRYEDGAWIPTYNGLTALFADSDHDATGVLVTTGDPDWPADHWEITLPGTGTTATGPHGPPTRRPGPGPGVTWWRRSTGARAPDSSSGRVDGTADAVAHNPVPEFAADWVGNLDAEPGSSPLAYTAAAGRQQSGGPTELRVVDLADGREVLALPIGGEKEQIVRLDLHDGAIALSTRTQVAGGVTLDQVRLVDLAAGTITTLPWGGTASFFHIAEPAPVAAYPAAATEMPELVVSTPIEGAVVNQALVRFEGYATPGAAVTAAGRYPVAVDAAGHWSADLTLNPGGNVAIFAAAFPGGPAAETARVVFRTTSPEMGYSLDLRYERGDDPVWVATVWVYDRLTSRRLPGVTVTLSVVDSWPEPLSVQLVTDDLGRVVHRIPITGGTALACIMDLQLAGYPSPPASRYSDLPTGSIACVLADYP